MSVQIGAIFRISRRTYGSPRIYAELQEQGVRCSRKRVARLMRHAGIHATTPRHRMHTTDSHHQLAVAPNVRDRDVPATVPDQQWVADSTYLPTHEGWSYLAVVLDVFSRRVVGWAIHATLESPLVVAALQNARAQRKPHAGLLHHSDRGSQYASSMYQQQRARVGIQWSISRKGNCWDNAAMESFFGTRKTE